MSIASGISEASFSIQYDGDALRAGMMDIRDLAPALESLADVCEEANSVLNGDDVRLRVNVRSEFRRGSFGIDFTAIQTIVDQGHHLLATTKLHDVREILEDLGFFGLLVKHVGERVVNLSLVGAVREIGGRKVKSIEDVDGEILQITTGDNSTINVTKNVYNLYRRTEIRGDLDEVVAPLDKPGIEVLRFLHEGKVVEEIPKEERPSFRPPPIVIEPANVRTVQAERIWQVRQVAFDPTLHFRFYTEESAKVSAPIADPDFWKENMAGHMSFKAGDLLRLYVRTVTTTGAPLDEMKLQSDHVVLRVIERIAQQGELFRNPDEGEQTNLFD